MAEAVGVAHSTVVKRIQALGLEREKKQLSPAQIWKNTSSATVTRFMRSMFTEPPSCRMVAPLLKRSVKSETVGLKSEEQGR
jgi:hypothetical protein